MTTSVDFKTCHSALYHSSPEMIQNRRMYQSIFELADGYGSLTWAQLDELGLWYDWSHVCDSSDEAISRMATAIRRVAI